MFQTVFPSIIRSYLLLVAGSSNGLDKYLTLFVHH